MYDKYEQTERWLVAVAVLSFIALMVAVAVFAPSSPACMNTGQEYVCAEEFERNGTIETHNPQQTLDANEIERDYWR